METQSVKKVGASGQISIGKEYAGRTVLIEQMEEGVRLIKTAQIIPDNEGWMHEEPAKGRIRPGHRMGGGKPAGENGLGEIECQDPIRSCWT